MLANLWTGSADARVHKPRKVRRGRPPLLVGQDAADGQEVRSPTRKPGGGSHVASSFPSSASAPSLHSNVPAQGEQQPHYPSGALPASSSTLGHSSALAHLAARSVSPTRPGQGSSGNTGPADFTVPALRSNLGHSGSAPSLPPLPPLLAPTRDRAVRSRSVVALHESRVPSANAETFQPLQRAGGLFRTAPLPIQVTNEISGSAGQGTLPPSDALVPPPPQKPQPPAQRQAQREETASVRLGPKLPTAVSALSSQDSRHWRESGSSVGRVEPSTVREGWGDARDGETRLPTARLSVV